MEIADLPADSNEYTDEGLASATTYIYRIRAYNSIANTLYSALVSATTLSIQNGSGGGCSLVAGQTAPVDVLLILIPLAVIFTAAVRRRR